MAVCVALGIPFFGLPTEQRRVTYLSCEDRENLLHWRLARICAWLGINLAEVAGILDVLDLVGRDSVMWASDPRTGFTFTSAFDRLGQQVARQQTQVLFVDGVSDTFGGNENARTEVKAYTNRMLSLTPTDGALVMLGHVAKPAAMNSATSEGYSGSTQWHNAVRARWYLYPETERSDDRDRPQRTGKLDARIAEVQPRPYRPVYFVCVGPGRAHVPSRRHFRGQRWSTASTATTPNKWASCVPCTAASNPPSSSPPRRKVREPPSKCWRSGPNSRPL